MQPLLLPVMAKHTKEYIQQYGMYFVVFRVRKYDLAIYRLPCQLDS